MTKTTHKRKYSTGDLLTVSELYSFIVKVEKQSDMVLEQELRTLHRQREREWEGEIKGGREGKERERA